MIHRHVKPFALPARAPQQSVVGRKKNGRLALLGAGQMQSIERTKPSAAASSIARWAMAGPAVTISLANAQSAVTSRSRSVSGLRPISMSNTLLLTHIASCACTNRSIPSTAAASSRMRG